MCGGWLGIYLFFGVVATPQMGIGDLMLVIFGLKGRTCKLLRTFGSVVDLFYYVIWLMKGKKRKEKMTYCS